MDSPLEPVFDLLYSAYEDLCAAGCSSELAGLMVGMSLYSGTKDRLGEELLKMCDEENVNGWKQ